MKETIHYHHNKEAGYRPDILWRIVESELLGKIAVKNKKDVGPDVNLTVVLCPLYASGGLNQSKLVTAGGCISDSRVAGKFSAYCDVVQSMAKYLVSVGGRPTLTTIFANKGVLHQGEPAYDQIDALSYHSKIYETGMQEIASQVGMNYFHTDYEQLGIDFPTFVDPNKPPSYSIDIDGNPHNMIDALNAGLSLPGKIVNNKKGRHSVKGVMRMEGVGDNGAYWLAAGYIVADHKIADVVGANGVYIAAERFGALFGLTRLTPKLYEKPRIQISA